MSERVFKVKIAVAGTGYVGLVTGVCLAKYGHSVVCVDVDPQKILLLQTGVSPIYEPELQELMTDHRDKLTFTTSYETAYKDADVIFIGVGTPERADGSADLTYVYEAAKQIAKSVTRDCVVVIKSTVPIGTTDKLDEWIQSHRKHPVEVKVASNPEFLSQGRAVQDTLYPSRIVIGVEDEKAEQVVREVYQHFHAPLVITNRKSAEMIKYASNDFLALKISFINEIANLCERIGADVEDVAKGMGFDSRISPEFLQAGIGYGGSCFPKDTKALHWLANFHDYEFKTVKAAIDVNEAQKIKLLKKVRRYFPSLRGLTVAVLGLTFKPETDDLREAPALVNIPLMLEDGATIKVWDPVAIPHVKKRYPTEITYCSSIDEALSEADVCFIFTEWNAVKKFPLKRYSELMRTPIVLDGRNCYCLEDVKKEKMIYDSIGRDVVQNMKMVFV